jgi:hypothetical protein
MTLINCPECGNEVSDQAGSCPDCGYPMTNNENTETNNSGFSFFGCLGWIGVFVLVCIVGLIIRDLVLALSDNPGVASIIGLGFILVTLGLVWRTHSQDRN